MKRRKKGVVLLNMGGPDTLADVQPFLYNLFADREIIRLGPPFLQKPLAWLISRRRAKKSSVNYAKIGGGSPLKAITTRQAQALAEVLQKDGDYHVSIAMRYWHPFADEVVTELIQQGIAELTLLTLYPHYSKATTGSSIAHFRRALDRLAPDLPVRIISSWPTHPYYIKALTDTILQSLKPSDSETTVVYSAHSLPVSFIQAGDPYVTHLKQTIEAIEAITQKPGKLCYQSRSGPVEWLTPSTPEMLESLAKEKCKNILMVPLSFVSDHIETLYEIDIMYREMASRIGLRLTRTESLNTHPLFIAALRALVCEIDSQTYSLAMDV